MACFYKSHSVAAAVADDMTLPRPVDTIMLVGGILYRSTNAAAPAYTGVDISGSVNIPFGDTLSFDTTDLVLTPDGNAVNWTGTAQINLAPSLNLVPVGVDFGRFYTITDELHQRPLPNANVAFPEANKNWEILGTNSAAAGSTMSIFGGTTITTQNVGGAGDEMIIWPHQAALQSVFDDTTWDTDRQPTMKCILMTAGDITAMSILVGFKVTATTVVATDNDQVCLHYNPALSANWRLLYRVNGGANTYVDTGVVVAINQVYRMMLWTQADRTVRLYLTTSATGQTPLVATSAALTATLLTLKPFMAVSQTGAGARAATFKRVAVAFQPV